jgi:hypothetical protein
VMRWQSLSQRTNCWAWLLGTDRHNAVKSAGQFQARQHGRGTNSGGRDCPGPSRLTITSPALCRVSRLLPYSAYNHAGRALGCGRRRCA